MSMVKHSSGSYVLTPFETRLLDQFQHGMPLSATPYRDKAHELSCSEEMVITVLQALACKGVLSRVGPVFEHRAAGASTLAAMAVPADRLEDVAAHVSSMREVNHNYQREHHWNLWFVVTAADQLALDNVLQRIEDAMCLPVLALPMERSYCLDLGFPVGPLARMPS